jgi:UDP-glucose 4-epimerase
VLSDYKKDIIISLTFIMTILITGGRGYIGSVACEKLMKKNRIIIYDQKKYINQDTNPNLIYIQGNILNSYKLNKVFKQNNIDLVIHLAAKISVSESVRHPFKYY